MVCFVQAKALEKKAAKKAGLEKLQGDAFTTCLVSPFVEAAKADRRRSLRALSQAWLAYLAHVQVSFAYCLLLPDIQTTHLYIRVLRKVTAVFYFQNTACGVVYGQ